jgi:hypothetical protein
MHNIKGNFDKIFQTIKSFNLNDFDANGNVPKVGRKPQFSDLEVISLNLAAEYMSIDSENFLFKKISESFSKEFPNLIDRTQFNRRKRYLFNHIDKIRSAIASRFLEFEDYYIVDSTPLEVCKLSRERRAKVYKQAYETSPDKGFCASQNMYFYGYKLHGVCSVNGVFHSIDLTRASVHDNEILKDLNTQMADNVLLGDKGYIGKEIQLNLFESSNIRLNTPMRNNQSNFKTYPKVFRKARKRLETLFSQLCDQFMIRRNYAKQFDGFRTRILSKITALTIIQFINYFILERPTNNIKHAII